MKTSFKTLYIILFSKSPSKQTGIKIQLHLIIIKFVNVIQKIKMTYLEYLLIILNKIYSDNSYQYEISNF